MKSKWYPIWLLLITITYFGAGELGLSQAFLHANVSPVWPPTGLAIATVWYLGYRISPAILLGAFLVNLATGVSIATAGGIAAGNTLEAVSAVFLLRHFVSFDNPFYRAQGTVKFVLITGGLSTTLSATIGILSLYLGGAAEGANFGSLWLTWWLGDFGGALVITPLLLTWIDKPLTRWTLPQLGEAGVLLASLLFVAAIVFGGWFLPKLSPYPIGQLFVPFLLWAAFRFGPPGATMTIAMLSGIAIWGTRQGFGPFAAYSPNESLLLLQVFVAGIAIMTLVLGAIVVERKQVQEALRAKEAQLQLITDITPVMLTQCSRDLRYNFVNRAYAEVFDLTPEQIMGKPISEIIGEEAFETIRPHVELVLQGQPVEYEAEISYQRAGPRFMSVAYVPDRDEQGKIIGWVASLKDITDRKRAEEALRQSEERFAKAFEASPLALTITSLKTGQLLEINETFTRLSGYTREVAVGRTTLELGLWTRVSDRETELAMVAQSGEVRNFESRFRMKDGTERVGLLSAERIEIGDEPCALTVIEDITEQKWAEAEREQLLSHAQTARAEAEAANRAKDEFLAMVSHELRTPLNAITGWMSLLRSDRFDGQPASRALEVVERNAKALSKLVEDILDASRIITRKFKLEFHPVDLTLIINAALETVRPTADTKTIGLEYSIDLKDGIVWGDPVRLQQIVLNLLSNAIKFTPPGGRVRLEAKRAGNQAHIIVRDTGEGISSEFLPHVFDRFQQADSSSTRKHSGLGLGLAIAYHLVEAHAGTIEAHSAGTGQGATFIVTLPLIEEARDFENVKTTPQIGLSMTQPKLSGIPVLIVEDDRDSLEMVRFAVQAQGAEVKTATRANEALMIVEQWIPDVLVSDLGLPDEDGYTLISKIRRLTHKKKSEIPAIAMTGYAGEQEEQRALAAGFQVYLTKPIDPDKLIEAIANLVGPGEQ